MQQVIQEAQPDDVGAQDELLDVDTAVITTVAAHGAGGSAPGFDVVSEAVRDTFGPDVDPVPFVLGAICRELLRIGGRDDGAPGDGGGGTGGDGGGDADTAAVVEVLGALVGGLFGSVPPEGADPTLRRLHARGRDLRQAILDGDEVRGPRADSM